MAATHSPIPDAQALTADVREATERVHDLRALNDLVIWIGRTRNTMEGQFVHARHNPAFAESLQKCDFPGLVDWDEDVNNGMEALHRVIAKCLGDIEKALSPREPR